MSERNNERPLNEGWQVNAPLKKGQMLSNTGHVQLTPANAVPRPPAPSVPQNKK